MLKLLRALDYQNHEASLDYIATTKYARYIACLMSLARIVLHGSSKFAITE
jgi:hypothetical protein